MILLTELQVNIITKNHTIRKTRYGGNGAYIHLSKNILNSEKVNIIPYYKEMCIIEKTNENELIMLKTNNLYIRETKNKYNNLSIPHKQDVYENLIINYDTSEIQVNILTDYFDVKIAQVFSDLCRISMHKDCIGKYYTMIVVNNIKDIIVKENDDGSMFLQVKPVEMYTKKCISLGFGRGRLQIPKKYANYHVLVFESEFQ